MPKDTFFNLPEDKRQRIIAAAIEEFGSQPYPSATLDRIVGAAGVSKGSMYQYFAGKADLYTWLVTQYVAEQKLAALNSSKPPAGAALWEVLEALYRDGLRFSLARPDLMRLGLRVHRDRDSDPVLKAIADERDEMGRRYLRELFVGAQARGELRVDAQLDVLTELVSHALGEGMIRQLAQLLGLSLNAFMDDPMRLAELSELEVLELVREVIDVFRRGVGATLEGP